MKTKTLILTLVMALCCPSLRAQTASGPVRELEGPARETAIAAVLKANDLKTTLQFRFVMTRHSAMLTEDLVSRGRVAYVYPDKLRWEVEQPWPSVFVMSGDVKGNRRQQTMLRTVSQLSEKGLINETDFQVTVYASPKTWQVDLVPLRRDLGQLFARITLMTVEGTGELRSVILSEAGGDTTLLEFSSVVRGQAVDSRLFEEQ